MIIAADAEPRTHQEVKGKIIEVMKAGGVSTALDPVARASNAVFVARSKTEEDKLVVDRNNKVQINDPDGNYTLKRIFLSDGEINSYYYGFSNQVLWPLCHVAFEKPDFRKDWYNGFKKVNQKFAEEIKRETSDETFIWVNDYQLSLVPKFLNKPKNAIVAMFWHIPWPTWEIFRTLPFKKEILESLLSCDFLAFHRGYQARNFLRTVETELEARIEDEKGKVYYANNVTTVRDLPMGIDTDVVRSMVAEEEETLSRKVVKSFFGIKEKEVKCENSDINELFEKYRVILGVDRLDYTKGLGLRLKALDKFFNDNSNFKGKVIYLGIVSPSRKEIPAYKALQKEVIDIANEINSKYEKKDWKPIHIINRNFPREQVLKFYRKAALSLVTPLDDGMNLVSKEFVIASLFSEDPGMLVLSQFAGSAIDLTSALIVNPYDTDEVADAIKRGLKMSKEEKVDRVKHMVEILDERNIYAWARDFVKFAQISKKESEM